MAVHCPSLATLCQPYGPQYHCIEARRTKEPWLAPMLAAKALQWCEAADIHRPGAVNPQREGAGPEVLLALASMAMGELMGWWPIALLRSRCLLGPGVPG